MVGLIITVMASRLTISYEIVKYVFIWTRRDGAQFPVLSWPVKTTSDRAYVSTGGPQVPAPDPAPTVGPRADVSSKFFQLGK